MAETSGALIDWDFAVRTAARLIRPGPQIGAAQAADVVAELRAGAARSEQPVRDYTGLHAPAGGAATAAPVLVVDRPGWVRANVDGFATVLQPLVDKVAAKNKLPSGASRAVGTKLSGAELGGLLAFLSSKVLGQFDPFWDDAGEGGRMLLVAPNIVHAERELEVDAQDFRLWVCLHEETHRVQFTAVPWMRGHLKSLIAEFVDATDVDPSSVGRLLSDGVREAGRVIRNEDGASIVDALRNPTQKAAIDKMTGVMSLLEGHADVVMDGVGPEVIASVDTIRVRFDERRKGAGSLDRLLRRLLGLDAKMQQYRDGAAFVRAVTDKVGADGFAAVWVEPDNLPSKSEVTDPDSWVARVHG